MNLNISELCSLLVAFTAILLVGSTQVRMNVKLFCLQTVLLAGDTFLYGLQRQDEHLYVLALVILFIKAIGVPSFLLWIEKRVGVQRDTGTLLPAPIAMHAAMGLMAVSYLLARQLPVPPNDGLGWPGATAAISLLFSGLIVMLTRRVALSQIVGFLVMENGIYLFGLTQTTGMPLLVEMGVMLDVLAGVMIAGLLAFRIKKSFEHIDVSALTHLKEQ